MVKVLPVFLLTGMLWPGPTPQAQIIALRQIRTLCLSDGPASRSGLNPDHDAGQIPNPVTLVPEDIARIRARPLSSKLRVALKSCH